MAVKRNLDGYSAVAAGDPLADLDVGNPRKWATFMEDFLAYEIAQAAGNPYTLTATNCVDTISGPTGYLVLTLGGADNDAGEIQLTESPFATTTGKRMYFEAKVKLTLASGGTVAANEIFVGLGTEQTTTNFMNAGGTALTVDNCLGFVKYDADSTLGSVSRKADAESSDGSLKTPVDGVFTTLAFYYDGGSSVKFYVDGVQVSELTSNIPTGDMTPTLWIKAGEAKANVLTTDYILVAIER